MKKINKSQQPTKQFLKKFPNKLRFVVLSSFGKISGGGHLNRTKKLANLLKSYFLSPKKSIQKYLKPNKSSPKSHLNSNPKKIHFTFLNSENLHNQKQAKHKKTSWQNPKIFTHIVRESSFVIIDSYKATRKHFKILLNKSSKKCNILILNDGVEFLDFILEIVATKITQHKHIAKALQRIIILNGGLGSEYLLCEVKNKIHNLSSDLGGTLLRYFVENNVFYGGQYFLANTDFIYKRAKQRVRIKHILITFGASDYLNATQQTTNALNEIFKNLEGNLECIFEARVCLHIVLGEFYPHKFMPTFSANLMQNNISSPTSKLTYKIYNNLKPQDFALLMSKCDIAISASGQSLYEIALNTLPFITIPTANNQLPQSKAFAKSGGGIVLNNVAFVPNATHKNNADFTRKLANALRNGLTCFTQKSRYAMSQNLAKLNIGKSSHKIATRFLQNRA